MAVELLKSGNLPCEGSRAAALSLLGEHRAALMSLMAWEGRLRESGEGMLPDSMLPFCFPAPYAGLVFQASDSILVDPGLLLGIIREESSFDHLATSSAGAKGLIQLMPGTASDVARWHDLPSLSGDDFYDPWNSLRYGSLYIDRQFRSYGGEMPLLLAAYNAGPGNASRWRDTFGYSPSDPEMFIEQITYRETRNYVKKVTRSAWVYRRLFQ
jgi:soluble lytic murein transglycosylase